MPGGSGQEVVERLGVLALDDENPGVFVQQSNGSTLVVACGNAACTIPGVGDSYQLRRRASQPTAQRAAIAIVTDGQTDVILGTPAVRSAWRPIGGLQASQAFTGNITVTEPAPTLSCSHGRAAPTSGASSTRASSSVSASA